ncbi:MAG: PQQ-binding-like beta-propeller repeat protein [Ignavibacteriae bacterium]|nr:PQQ-binding-like beta-propeller repeat protein [Ignavibacteriota bacterium]
MIDEIEYKDSSGAVASPLILPNSDIIVSTVKGNILSIAQKQVKWLFKLDSNDIPSVSLAADGNMNIYIITRAGKLYSLSKNGTLNWKKNYFNSIDKYDVFSELLTQDDGLIAAISNGEIVKIGIDGKLLWKLKSLLSPTKTFAADGNGNIYITLTNDEFGKTDSLLCISKSGNLVWKKGFENTRLIRTPVIFNKRIYLVGISISGEQKVSTLYSLDEKGNVIWKKELLLFARFISVDIDGKIYVTGYNSGIGEAMSGIFCFSADGKLQWKKYFEVIIPYVNDRNSTGVYFTKKDGTLYEVVGLENMPVLYLQPAVTSDPLIIFSGAEKLCFVSIDAPPFDKFLPW